MLFVLLFYAYLCWYAMSCVVCVRKLFVLEVFRGVYVIFVVTKSFYIYYKYQDYKNLNKTINDHVELALTLGNFNCFRDDGIYHIILPFYQSYPFLI